MGYTVTIPFEQPVICEKSFFCYKRLLMMMENTIVSVGTCSLYFVLLACLGRINGFRDLVPWYELQG